MAYVGSSKHIMQRRNGHMKAARRGDAGYFHQVLKEFTLEAFDFEIVEECPQGILLDREFFFINFYDSVYPNGFNVRDDPRMAWDYMFSDAVRKKISDTLKGCKLPQSTKDKISVTARRNSALGIGGHVMSNAERESKRKLMTGNKFRVGCKETPEAIARRIVSRAWYKHSDETRKKLSIANSGKKRSKEVCKAMSEYRNGKPGHPSTPETNAKISAKNKGKKRTNKAKENISKAHLGKPWSEARRACGPVKEATKAKISATLKAKNAKSKIDPTDMQERLI